MKPTRKSSDVLGGRRRGFRVPVGQSIALWTGLTMATLGLACLAAVALMLPGGAAGGFWIAAGLWVVLSGLGGAFVGWRLSGVLARPGDTLLAIKRIDGEASPVDRYALATAYRDLDELLVRTAHEKNGRISELTRAREISRVEDAERADFFASMSHELRTPLNAIIGYAMLLAEDAEKDGKVDEARDLERILQSGRQLLRLINDILEVSRVEDEAAMADRASLAAAVSQDESAATGVDQSANVVPLPIREPAQSRGQTVLVIDDDEPTLDLMRRWLTGQGYTVVSANNGADGLALARSKAPAFVILDVFMPGQSGYDVLAEMKADEALRNIPVIIASSDDNRRQGLEAGAAEVLVKPLSRQRLHSVLDVLGQQMKGDLLVVDDDEDVREIVQRYAVQAGFTVRLAADGAEGMAMAREKTPGAIILDLCMPGTDGFGMIEALAHDPSLSHVPVMVLSQLDIDVRDHARIQKAGHLFRPKWKSSPIEIVENIKTMVASR